MLPALSPWPPNDGDAPRFLARPFAVSADDLNVDFEGEQRMALVTELLAQCLHHADGARVIAKQAWAWTMSERLQGLLCIARASNGPLTHAVATCQHTDCAGRVELELGIETFAVDNASRLAWQSPDGDQLSVRVPDGLDLLAWQSHSAQRDADAEISLASSLIESINDRPPPPDWQIPRTWVEPLASALAQADPLTALTLDVPCPYCARSVAVEVDLEWLLIDGLRQRQMRLTDEVHRLAAHYHWSERDIADLPAWRRHRYLARLQAELA